MTKIAIILGSTRPNRFGEPVARWFYEHAKLRKGIEVELLDLAEENLPFIDEPMPPAMEEEYANEHTRRWAEKIAPADGYVFVTAEYNYGIPGAMKNAIDFLDKEWHNKAVGFVSYGADKGVRSVDALRQVVANVQMADIRQTVPISIFTDVDENGVFQPNEQHEASADALLDQLTSWAEAMKSVRKN